MGDETPEVLLLDPTKPNDLDQLREIVRKNLRELPPISPSILPEKKCGETLFKNAGSIKVRELNPNLFMELWNLMYKFYILPTLQGPMSRVKFLMVNKALQSRVFQLLEQMELLWLLKLMEMPLDNAGKKCLDSAISECGVDVLAWYRPLHSHEQVEADCPKHEQLDLFYYDHEGTRGWGIYITFKGIRYIASLIGGVITMGRLGMRSIYEETTIIDFRKKSVMTKTKRGMSTHVADGTDVSSILRYVPLPSSYTAALLAMESLWQHEQFHYLVEAYSMYIERVLGQPRYREYSDVFYHQKWPHALEDALANRYVLESPHVAAIKTALMERFDRTPGSYREYKNYMDDERFKQGIGTLCNLMTFLRDGNQPMTSMLPPFPLIERRSVPTYIVIDESDIVL